MSRDGIEVNNAAINKAAKATLDAKAIGDRPDNGNVSRATAILNDKVKYNKAYKEKMVWIK